MPDLAAIARRTLLRRVLHWIVPGALLAGCRRPPAAPPPPAPLSVTDLHFPAAVIFSHGSIVTFDDADSLGTMNIGNVINADGPPSLIDSQFGIYHLAKLRSTHGGLWLMANPVGVTAVSFELQPAPQSGLEAARTLFRAQLDEQTWRHDLEQKRRELATQKTLAGMLAIVQTPP